MAIYDLPYAIIQWTVDNTLSVVNCSAILSGLEAVGATVTALYGEKVYEGVIVELGKPIHLLLVIVYLTTTSFSTYIGSTHSIHHKYNFNPFNINHNPQKLPCSFYSVDSVIEMQYGFQFPFQGSCHNLDYPWTTKMLHTFCTYYCWEYFAHNMHIHVCNLLLNDNLHMCKIQKLTGICAALHTCIAHTCCICA